MTVTGRPGADHPGCDPVGYFDAVTEAFSRAQERAGLREHDIAVGGVGIRLRFAGPALEPLVLPALAHLAVTRAPLGGAALTVSLFDSLSTTEPMPPPAWGVDAYGPRGEITGYNDERIRTVFQPGVDVLNLYDSSRRAGISWVAEPGIMPWWESSAPLRTILHWWAAPTSLQPVHAGSVGRGGRGVLLAGSSGAGKSTTALACLEAGWEYAGDDYVLIDVESARVHGLYGTAKLEPDNLARFPGLAPLVANRERLDTEKAMVFLCGDRPEHGVTDFELQAIVLPRVTGRSDSQLAPTSPAAALRVLAATTSSQLPGYGREVFTKLNTLVRTLPCYRLDAGTDLEQLAATLAVLVEA